MITVFTDFLLLREKAPNARHNPLAGGQSQLHLRQLGWQDKIENRGDSKSG
jgi:hypothetical protein